MHLCIRSSISVDESSFFGFAHPIYWKVPVFMDSNDNTPPALEMVAILIVIAAVLKGLYTKGLEWLNDIQAFCVAIWPTVFSLIVCLSLGFLAFKIGRFALARWKEHENYVCDLREEIETHEKTIAEKDTKIEKLERASTQEKARSLKFKKLVIRYNRLLARKYSAEEKNPKLAQKKIKSALASVLQDFGSSTAPKREGRSS